MLLNPIPLHILFGMAVADMTLPAARNTFWKQLKKNQIDMSLSGYNLIKLMAAINTYGQMLQYFHLAKVQSKCVRHNDVMTKN